VRLRALLALVVVAALAAGLAGQASATVKVFFPRGM